MLFSEIFAEEKRPRKRYEKSSFLKTLSSFFLDFLTLSLLIHRRVKGAAIILRHPKYIRCILGVFSEPTLSFMSREWHHHAAGLKGALECTRERKRKRVESVPPFVVLMTPLAASRMSRGCRSGSAWKDSGREIRLEKRTRGESPAHRIDRGEPPFPSSDYIYYRGTPTDAHAPCPRRYDEKFLIRDPRCRARITRIINATRYRCAWANEDALLVSRCTYILVTSQRHCAANDARASLRRENIDNGYRRFPICPLWSFAPEREPRLGSKNLRPRRIPLSSFLYLYQRIARFSCSSFIEPSLSNSAQTSLVTFSPATQQADTNSRNDLIATSLSSARLFLFIRTSLHSQLSKVRSGATRSFQPATTERALKTAFRIVE